MIWRRLINGKSQKLFEGDSIIDLAFQLRVGVDAEPLLEKKAFQKKKRMVIHENALINGLSDS